MLFEDVAVVRLYLLNSVADDYFVPKEEVALFVTALINLHWGAGNPHIGQRLNNLRKIVIYDTGSFNRYWWCTPDLKKNDDPSGARVSSFRGSKVAWDRYRDEAGNPIRRDWVDGVEVVTKYNENQIALLEQEESHQDRHCGSHACIGPHGGKGTNYNCKCVCPWCKRLKRRK